MSKKSYNPTIRAGRPKAKVKKAPFLKRLPKHIKLKTPSPDPICFCPFCGQILDYMKVERKCSNCEYIIGVDNKEDGSLEWSSEMAERIPLPKDWWDKGKKPSSTTVEDYSEGFVAGIQFHWRKYHKIGNPSERRY